MIHKGGYHSEKELKDYADNAIQLVEMWEKT